MNFLLCFVDGFSGYGVCVYDYSVVDFSFLVEFFYCFGFIGVELVVECCEFGGCVYLVVLRKLFVKVFWKIVIVGLVI